MYLYHLQSKSTLIDILYFFLVDELGALASTKVAGEASKPESCVWAPIEGCSGGRKASCEKEDCVRALGYDYGWVGTIGAE